MGNDHGSYSNQDRVMHLVSLLPGIHLRELQRLLGISFNSTRYNVGKLCVNGSIMGRKEKGYLRLYPPGTKESERVIYSLLRSGTLKAILAALLNKRDGLTHKQLGERTGFAKSTVSENLERLTRSGLVEVRLSDRLKEVYVLQNSSDLFRILMNVRSNPSPTSATDRFIDLWDF